MFRRFLLLSILCTLCSAAAAQAKIHRVVIEVNLPGTNAYNFVLNNVENIKKAFAPEAIEIEVVCHGPGLDMLYANSSIAGRVTSAYKSGVVFAACRNTIQNRKIEAKKLDTFIKIVPSGAAEVIRKQEAGWSYLKGAY